MSWHDSRGRWMRYARATEGMNTPLAILDLDAFDANRRDLLRRANGTPIRVASKSIRSRRALASILTHDGFSGVMAFSLAEAIWLATEHRSWEPLPDILVGYPSVDAAAIAQLAADPELSDRITVMTDDIAHLDLLDEAVRTTGNQIRVCIDVDSSWRPRGPRSRPLTHVGARRSPLHEVDEVLTFTREVLVRKGLRLVGLMFYEAQIAGVGDRPAGRKVRGQFIHLMQSASGSDLAERRPLIVNAVARELADRGRAELEFVNSGGTGSIELSAADPTVTEVTAGSGFYGPTLFDDYRHFSVQPAAAFGVPVVRRPGPGWVTVLGGGYVASGAADSSRLPTPWLPEGLSLDSQEGAGEVQTPLKGHAADGLGIGDLVWFRPAKAGEMCEHFNELLLIRGDEVTQAIPTYRGEGKVFV